MTRLILRMFAASVLLTLLILAPFLAGCATTVATTGAAAADQMADRGYLDPSETGKFASTLTGARPGAGPAGAAVDPLPTEELWVIEKPEKTAAQQPAAAAQHQDTIRQQRRVQGAPIAAEEIPGQGQLVARIAQQLVPVPL